MSLSLEKGTEWQLVEESVNEEDLKQNEALFTLANGHIGIRGCLEEGHRNTKFIHNDAVYMNGFYETTPIQYGEWAYGYAKNHQTICSLPSSHQVAFSVNKEWFDLSRGTIKKHQRILDLKEGILYRNFQWTNEQSNIVEVAAERFVSYSFPDIAITRYMVRSLDDDLELEMDHCFARIIGSEVSQNNDPRVAKGYQKDYEIENVSNDSIIIKKFTTFNSKMKGLMAVITDTNNSEITFSKKDDEIMFLKRKMKKGESLTVDIFTAYKRIEDSLEGIAHIQSLLKEVKELGFEKMKSLHIRDMEEFWENSDIQVKGNRELQKGLRFNIFHLNQAAGRDGKTNIAAKGLTGPGYEGHYFWDTEMYMIPFFTYTQPQIAKQLLLYRYSILPKAKERARELGVKKGVLFPWRTINGEEASAYYPAGSAQVHINADIAHAVHTYIQATEDRSFARKEGLEILVETARFWIEFGYFDSNKNHAFVINGVTGPDEYTAIVNNNYYTNLMAKHNLLYAFEAVSEALEDIESGASRVLEQINYHSDEKAIWKEAANKILLPYDDTKKLTMQDDSVFSKEIWDFKNTPKDHYPLLLHYHPMIIYRHQVNKQADTILAQFIYPEDFSAEQKRRDYEYYEKITTHDSSLSRSIFGIMASELNDCEKAYSYFMDTALMDVTDLQSNTRDGLHLANMGGSWMSIVYGFAGMRIIKNTLSFSPSLPEQWKQIVFHILFKKRKIRVSIDKYKTDYKVLAGKSITILENGNEIKI